MEIDVVEGLGERCFTHPRGLQHLDAVLIAQDARFPGTGARDHLVGARSAAGRLI
jgi:hypothetical protein